MLIRYASDLHLDNFYKHNIDYKLPELPTDKETVLILAGDVCETTRLVGCLEYYASRFAHVVFVPGNHEYYKSDLEYYDTEMQKYFKKHPNIHYLQNDVFETDEVVFIGATLWTDYVNENEQLMQWSNTYMDYYLSTYRRQPLTSAILLQKFKESRDYIFEQMMYYPDKEIVVITHHAPSMRSIHPKFKFAGNNGCYASNLDQDIIDCKPTLWIHGHVHNSFDYTVGKTTILCNPRGYYPNGLNLHFNEKALVEI